MSEPRIVECDACHARIFFVPTARSDGKKRIPLNADPDPLGNIIVNDAGRAQHTPANAFDERKRYISHFATCPNAGEFRRDPR